MYSILHISDLHRSPQDNITNAELISALISDRQRYLREDPQIKEPDAIVISGDIVQGVCLGTEGAAALLDEQYSVALEFIVELTNRFVGGDRSKVVIVPGNHDIDWAMSKSAMQASEDKPLDLAAELCRLGTTYRWDWKTRQLFQIANKSVYDQRLDAYWRFFNQFYTEDSRPTLVSGPRPFDNIYTLYNGRIGVAAFNSCHGNDCFAFHGSIPQEIIARTHLGLTDKGTFDLLVAVWHHNVDGPPYKTDYMDLDTVRSMIGRGFRLGLYGHRHRPGADPVQIHLAGRETMAIVSAGSLCAGPRELPTGAHRSYNIIEIHDDMKTARVHMREMSVSNLFCAARRTAYGGNSWIDLAWDSPADLAGRSINFNIRKSTGIVEKAESELKAGRPLVAKKLLQPMGADLTDFGRKLLIESARRTDDKALLSNLLNPPLTIGEFVEGIDIYIQSNNLSAAHGYLNKYGNLLGVTEPHLSELRARLAALEAIKL